MLPCEFCEEMFPERDLMRHQTSCDHNETKNPREYLLARRSSVTSPSSAPNSPSSALTTFYTSSKPPTSPMHKTPESLAITVKTKTPPHSPSLRSHHFTSSSPIQQLSTSTTSPQLSVAHSDGYDSAFDSRNNSLSPAISSPPLGTSVCGASSGVSSICSSSTSTTPSTSSSASPIPVPPLLDTPTDIEADNEEEEVSVPRPRKGRLLSSAIISWRSISGEKSQKEKPKYFRSNTAPVQCDGNVGAKGVNNSHSATNIKSPQEQDDSDEELSNDQKSTEAPKSNAFKRNRNKYPAPKPPCLNVRDNDVVISSQCSSSKEPIFKFDSVPLMRGQTSTSNEETSNETYRIDYHFFSNQPDSHEKKKVGLIFVFLKHTNFLKLTYSSNRKILCYLCCKA